VVAVQAEVVLPYRVQHDQDDIWLPHASSYE
jgi:hypothetical protein